MKTTLSLNHHARAMAMSLLVLLFALGLVWLGQWIKTTSNPKVTVREVSFAAPPPPPPPPPPPSVQQPVVETPISLQTQGDGPSLDMLDIHQADIKLAKPDAPSVTQTAPQWQSLEVNWEAFGLDDLDALPSILTKPQLKLPQSLTRRGIKRVEVNLEILVDEQGRVQLISLLDNPYPELIEPIKSMLRNTRFTPPKKGDTNVRAKFILPLEIQA